MTRCAKNNNYDNDYCSMHHSISRKNSSVNSVRDRAFSQPGKGKFKGSETCHGFVWKRVH